MKERGGSELGWVLMVGLIGHANGSGWAREQRSQEDIFRSLACTSRKQHRWPPGRIGLGQCQEILDGQGVVPENVSRER